MPIPTKSKQLKRSDGRKCRHLLDQLRELTFVVQDPGAIASLRENLSTQLAKMQQYKPSEDGLVLEGGDSKSYTRTNQKTCSKTQTAVEKKCRAELPKRSTKTKDTGRVGKNAAINRKTYPVHVPICSTARAKPSYKTEAPSPKSVFSNKKFTLSPTLAGRIVPSTIVQYRHREKSDGDAKDSW